MTPVAHIANMADLNPRLISTSELMRMLEAELMRMLEAMMAQVPMIR